MGRYGKDPASTYEVLGEALTCRVCGHDKFHRREAQLNTKMMTFFSLDWANPSAACFVCERCGYIHWFMPQ